jgi:hypothetical protein
LTGSTIPPAVMQEPEIFEQPVASRDLEAHDGGAYGTTGTIYSTGLGPASPEDDVSDDYHDFVYPEGGLIPFCFLLLSSVRVE